MRFPVLQRKIPPWSTFHDSVNGLVFWRRNYTGISPPHSPKVKVLWCHVKTKVRSQNHRTNRTRSAASLSGIAQGEDVLVWSVWLPVVARLTEVRWQKAGKKPDPHLTDGWPQLKGKGKHFRKYLPMRLFLRKILRIVKFILMLGKWKYYFSLIKKDQEEKQYSWLLRRCIFCHL